MINLTLEELLQVTEGYLYNGEMRELSIDYVSIDSRTIKENSIFIALRGDNFNGNLFWKDAINKGAKVIILDEKPYIEGESLQEIIIIVKDTKKALLDLAKYYRKKLEIKVVGVTGSTGKTSTKDLIAAALSDRYKVYKTKGNYNNDIGMPLSILNIHDDVEVAVLEMGMNHAQEIHRLADIARPDVGVITNIGITHIENLKTQENIFKAKMEIADFFQNSNVLIINGDDEYLRKVENKNYKVLKTGIEEKNHIIAGDIVSLENGMRFTFKVNNQNKELFLPLLGVHSIYNCLLAIGVGVTLGATLEEIEKGIENLEATAMRLEIFKKGDITVINDCYNASPTSMKAAIDVLSKKTGKKKIAVLGYMAELGDYTESAHIEIGAYAKGRDIDMLLTLKNVGELYCRGYGNRVKVFDSADELISELNEIAASGDVILIKASRSQHFEEITKGFLNY
ncbi:UDP-N-acetylmuramoyl-tripeptide--D-alanyl-D-alanine ligase [Alloiococcus sp. CFN-8]|uniref:UDP-N-acetylmuramoyl-tripeptide--D-alanyl-D- alanine ligase n=1 Tax=Alloiococcus sp. CFN-8 TaxID=3416081 RepID=UPI003CF1D23C